MFVAVPCLTPALFKLRLLGTFTVWPPITRFVVVVVDDVPGDDDETVVILAVPTFVRMGFVTLPGSLFDIITGFPDPNRVIFAAFTILGKTSWGTELVYINELLLIKA